MDSSHLRGQARRGDAADGVRGAVHRRSHARRPRPAGKPHAVFQEAPVPQEVQQGRPRGGHRREGTGHRPAEGRLRAGAALQPCTLQAGRAQPEQAAHHLGADPEGRADHHPEDRQARLCRDGEERQHRRLDPDLGRLLARRADGEGHRHPCQGDPQQQVHGQGAEHAQGDALDRQLDGLQLRPRLERHQPGIRRRPGRHVHQRFGRVHQPRAGLQRQSVHLRSHDGPARQEQEGRRARRRHARSRPPEGEQGPALRGHEMDQLLLRVAARLEEAGDPEREDAGCEPPAGRRARAPALQQEAIQPGEQVDQALHQRPARPHEAVPERDLQAEAHPGARGIDPERLQRPQLRRRGGADEPGYEHRADAPASERSGAGRDQAGNRRTVE